MAEVSITFGRPVKAEVLFGQDVNWEKYLTLNYHIYSKQWEIIMTFVQVSIPCTRVS